VTVRGRVLAGERGLEPLCILGRVAADERLGRARLDAVIRRIADLALDIAGTDVEADEGAHRRRLVPALRAVDHERALDLHARERFGHELRHRLAERAHDEVRRRGGITQRTEDDEYGSHAERLAYRRYVIAPRT